MYLYFRWSGGLSFHSVVFLVTCALTALEAVPIDIDKTKVKAAQPVDSAKIEPPVSEMTKITLLGRILNKFITYKIGDLGTIFQKVVKSIMNKYMLLFNIRQNLFNVVILDIYN